MTQYYELERMDEEETLQFYLNLYNRQGQLPDATVTQDEIASPAQSPPDSSEFADSPPHHTPQASTFF
jgi:hypothetical protein